MSFHAYQNLQFFNLFRPKSILENILNWTLFSGDSPGLKLNEAVDVIVTESTNEVLHDYRELRELLFKEGKQKFTILVKIHMTLEKLFYWLSCYCKYFYNPF